MKRTKFTHEQIIGILGEHEAGAKYADLYRKHGMPVRPARDPQVSTPRTYSPKARLGTGYGIGWL